jgi:excisionase family DNA binding protein
VEGYLTVQEVAKHFGVEPTTIYDWRKTLGLPGYRFSKGKRGGTVKFKLSEVQHWAEQFKQGRR